MICTLYDINGARVYHPRNWPSRDGELELVTWEGVRVPDFLFEDWPNSSRRFPYPNHDVTTPYELDIDGVRHAVPVNYGRAVGLDILYLLADMNLAACKP